MKVVKKAEGYRVICKHCMSELEFELSDIADDLFSNQQYIICPLCKNRTTVSTGYFSISNLEENIYPVFGGNTDEE